MFSWSWFENGEADASSRRERELDEIARIERERNRQRAVLRTLDRERAVAGGFGAGDFARRVDAERDARERAQGVVRERERDTLE